MKYINQILGFILIMSVIILNTIVTIVCMVKELCIDLDTFSWGFMNGIVIMVGLLKLGDTR